MRQGRIAVLGAAFVITGAGALVVEQAFEKLLSTVVGSSVDAGAIVLGIYFLGMSIGASCFHLLRRRVRNGAQLYALLEGSIGAWALLLGAAFPAIQAGSAAAIQLAGSGAGSLFLARAVVAACWIAPPTFAMGASFPAIVSWLKGQGGAIERRASVFYALNTAGALLGAAGAAYALFPLIGLQQALLLVGVLEIVVAAAVFTFSRRDVVVDEADVVVSIGAVFRAAGARRPLVAAFVSGFAVFSFEVLWLHLGGVTVGMSAYSFAGVLVVVLLGLVVGGSIASALPASADKALSVAFAVAVVAVVAVYPSWDDIPARFTDFSGLAQGFWSGEAVRLLLLASVVGIPAVGLGLVYPTVLRLPVEGVARDGLVAALGLVNGIGSISGALLVNFVLIGVVGSEGTYRLLAMVLVAGLALTATSLRTTWASLGVGLIAVGLLTSFDVWDRLALTSGTNVYFRQSFVDPDSELVFWHEDHAGGITTVVRAPRGELTLLTNGKFQGNDTGEMVDQTSFALVPVALTPGRDRALVIGLGTGQSASAVAASGFASVDVAEIAEGMVESAAWFKHANGDVLHRDNVHIKLGDGRNLLMREAGTYDLISMEITSIWFAGAANLYSEEFYRLASSRLRPDGVFQQWMQLHHIGADELASTLATVRAVFPYASLWMVGSQGIIIASRQPTTFDPARLDVEGLAPQRALLAGAGVDLGSLATARLVDEETFTRLLDHARSSGLVLNTDGNRHLEFMTPRYNLVRDDLLLANLRWLHDFVDTPERKGLFIDARRRIYGR
ncbi:MAG TPA: hypothetical protein VGF99_00085 [Myxococcota bacterium]